jgi:hypothetical protein
VASWLVAWLLQELRCPRPAGLLAALRCRASVSWLLRQGLTLPRGRR